jgi:uncharacterized protein YtpQ (UPF0354 family)
MNMNELRQRVMDWLQRCKPDFAVEPSETETDLVVNGCRLDLSNLSRMCAQQPGEMNKIIENYLRQSFETERDIANLLDWNTAQMRILPRINPESIFENLDRNSVAHSPFVNGTVITYVLDLPDKTVSLTVHNAVRWDKSMDDLHKTAIENLENYEPDLETRLIKSREGGRAAIISHDDSYDAARILLPDFHRRLVLELGRNFYVATPARDMLVAFSTGPESFVGRIKARMLYDFQRLPYPITPDLFHVTRDGISGMRPDSGVEENSENDIPARKLKDIELNEGLAVQRAKALRGERGGL